MYMKKIRIIALLLMTGVFSAMTMAQNISPVDFMRNNPRANFANPASFTSVFGYFDLALGGINVTAQNIGFKYDNFAQFNAAGQPVAINLNQGVASLRNTNYLNTFLNFDIFNCGRQTRYGYFTYSHRIREMETFRYNKGMMELLANGNGAFLGTDHPATVDLGVALRAYQEFNFGYQMCLTENLNIGARVKFIMGLADAKSKSFNMQLVTDPQTYALSVSGGVDVRTTLPYELSLEQGHLSVVDSRFNIANLFKNYGAGIDLGAEYRINDQFGVAASINDLGFINWNHFSTRFYAGVENSGSYYQNGALVFQGLSSSQVNDLINGNADFSGYIDSLIRYFNIGAETMPGYTSGLNTTMMVRGYYDLTPQHRFSAQLTGYASGVGFRPAMTLAYVGSFLNNFDVVTTYTMMKGSYGNLGIGLSANLGGSLFYIASNNVLGFFNPVNTSNLNIQFGITFTSGYRYDRSDRIVIKEKAEEVDDSEFDE